MSLYIDVKLSYKNKISYMIKITQIDEDLRATYLKEYRTGKAAIYRRNL